MFTKQSFHISLEIWGCVFCVIGAIFLFAGRNFETKNKRLLISIQLCMALLLLMDGFAWFYRGVPGPVAYYMVRISNFFVFLMSDVVLIFFHAYVCNHIFPKNSERKERCIRVPLVYWTVGTGIFLLIISQFNHMYYYFDENNLYHRNTMHPIVMLIGVIVTVIDMSLLIQYRRRLKKEKFLAMISYIVLPVIATVILIFYYGISLVNISLTISSLFMLLVEMVEQSHALAEQEKEIYDLKVNIMLSQIKPHFIYNTLTTIRHLCKTDQEMAVETIDDFTRYLRGNLDSLTTRKNISFEHELDHVKSYLAIEQKRFGERVQVQYDIEVDDFMIPPLTLQPIVENAVKHGITKRLEGGTIHISTMRHKDVIYITVKDDGVGFADNHEEEQLTKTHVGIENVRNRLESMCGGSLEIKSIPDVGTTVWITIPVS
ncbi:MAG: sensor histidine kinase [Wujia sp.]